MKSDFSNDHFLKPSINLIDEALKKLSDDINNQVEKFMIEGLERKGFVFTKKFPLERKMEIERFVNMRCSCADYTDIKERVYSVDGIDFMVHKYDIGIEQHGTTITAKTGGYYYL